MRKLVLATASLLAMTVASNANIIQNLGINPTSAAGAFEHTPIPQPGFFDDQYTFQLVGGPMFLTIASVTNTFAQTSDFITGFTGEVVRGTPGGVGNVVVIGPISASACVGVPDCQGFSGSATLDLSGNYFLDISGTAGGTSGYGGNLSVHQVPGPIVGAGLPGLVTAMLGFWGWRRKRRVA